MNRIPSSMERADLFAHDSSDVVTGVIDDDVVAVIVAPLLYGKSRDINTLLPSNDGGSSRDTVTLSWVPSIESNEVATPPSSIDDC